MSWAETKWLLDKVNGGMQEFTTPGAHTFTVPAGVTTIYITACAGGGGGGYNGSGGGCGGEAVLNYPAAVTSGQVISINIGSGGIGGTNSQDATNGGNTTIGSILTLIGGDSGDTEYFTKRRGAGVGGWGLSRNFESSNNDIGENYLKGTDGILGKAGWAPLSTAGGGNGGGSLGDGGAGSYNIIGGDDRDFSIATAGIRGGGGGGGCYYRGAADRQDGANGGDGYVCISWGASPWPYKA